MSDLYIRIYKVVQSIPSGRVTNYGSIARYVGSPRGSRMVGWALKQSGSYGEFIPAHRVVNRLGRLTGKHRFSGSEMMKQLLESEGIEIIDDQIQNFDEVFWDPGKELDSEVI